VGHLSYITGMALETFPTDRLKTLRESAGMTRTELAAALGVVERTIERWEAGISVPRLREQRALYAQFPSTNGKRKAR
jgi:DNA-binding transcriptional regulator YiaG